MRCPVPSLAAWQLVVALSQLCQRRDRACAACPCKVHISMHANCMHYCHDHRLEAPGRSCVQTGSITFATNVHPTSAGSAVATTHSVGHTVASKALLLKVTLDWVGPGGKARCDGLVGGPSGQLELLELDTQRAVGVKGEGGIAIVDVSAAGARLISFQKGGRSPSLLAVQRGKNTHRCCVSLPR